jgi:hypothetical protein
VFQLHFSGNHEMRLTRKVNVPVLTGGSGSQTRSVTEIFQRVD